MRLCEAMGLALITMGDVMVREEVGNDEAWSEKYRDVHVKYLTSGNVPPAVIDELVNKTADELFAFIQTT